MATQLAGHVAERSIGVRSTRGWTSAGAGALAAVVVFTVLLWTHPMSDAALTAFDDLAQLAAATLGGCGAAWAAIRAWRVEQQRLAASWALIALGCWGWAWGEAIWSLYEIVLKQEVPFPSLADVGFLLLPLLAGVGLQLWPTGFVAGRDRLAALLDGLIIGSSLLLISWATALGATLQAGGDTLAVIIGAAYPLGDVLMASLVVLLLTRAEPTNRPALVLLSLGILGLAIADSAFMYGTSTGTYSSGALLDAGWFAGFLAIGVAGIAMGAAPSQQPRGRRLGSWHRLALPYVPAGLALLTVFVRLVAGDPLHIVETLCALVIIGAVLARQFLVLADNRELLTALDAGEEEQRRLAFRDPLTGLATRALFDDRLRHALRRAARDGVPRSVLMVDLDDFAQVNHGLGEAAGDQVLIEAASMLRSCVREADTVARLDGDEFAVVLEAGYQPPERIAQRVVDGMRAVVNVSGEPVPMTASVGLAVHSVPRARVAAEDLVLLAERALDQAKNEGKDRYTVVSATPTGSRLL
jgi:diguanylate cyclase (GGDEF)-like protein